MPYDVATKALLFFLHGPCSVFCLRLKDSFIIWFVTFAYKWQVNETIEELNLYQLE